MTIQVHADINKLAKLYILPEAIDITEAVAILKKPREGAITYPFKRDKLVSLPKPGPTPAKQMRMDNTSENETGM